MKKQIIMGVIVFSGDLDRSDPDAAEVALREAGFEVRRMPERLRPLLYHPLDDFIEATITGASDKYDELGVVMGKINAIVNQYEGWCDSCGPIPEDYVPFSETFGMRAKLRLVT